ncbi:helix-turn-helix domain-containing protein [Bacillus mangrovi]|uniref:Helix-turn-helix domain-containing protein n=1 Tax=Metabacillus mangrovi TaxID=1491830 RepID=A0A7X2V280_9BACI|nr:helix-turn-helix transcriptional regulator [Metabacillus mangrovi]MTH51882.1 helix-turn-helix domain-containing protein [Metabacillus mangrovi]
MITAPCSNYGAFIKEGRINKGWTEEQFAERLMTTRSYIGKIERGEVHPSETLILRISKELNISHQELQLAIWCDPPHSVCS